MCWLYLVQDVSDAPVPSDLSSTLVIQDDNAFFHVMSNNTSNSYLIARAIFDSIPIIHLNRPDIAEYHENRSR